MGDDHHDGERRRPVNFHETTTAHLAGGDHLVETHLRVTNDLIVLRRGAEADPEYSFDKLDLKRHDTLSCGLFFTLRLSAGEHKDNIMLHSYSPAEDFGYF